MSIAGEEIEWCDPPPSLQGRADRSGRRIRFVNELRGRPGEWAKYGGGWTHRTAGSHLAADFPGVETTSRIRADGLFEVYARWVDET